MIHMKKAFVTGITGQDGSYMIELLLSKNYKVHGLIRRSSTFNTSRIHPTILNNPNLNLHYGDLSDSEQINKIISNYEPDEIYNLAAQSHVRVSFDSPEYTGNITGLGATRILEAIRLSNYPSRFYQASSSEMFGTAKAPQNEFTELHPRSPYGCAKIYAYWMTRNYREGYDMFASNGILFNHESPRRGESFVTRKITLAIAKILAKKQFKLTLGNLDAQRDWGFAPEYVEVMWDILQAEHPGDYVIGTGESHYVKDFLFEAFDYAGLNALNYVMFDETQMRATEVDKLQANISRAQSTLHWEPQIKFKDLVKIMVDSDMRLEGLTPIGEGDAILKRKFPNRWWIND
jgi:GDPmannose 4,6-dehydratase